jgi:hypothetical protein
VLKGGKGRGRRGLNTGSYTPPTPVAPVNVTAPAISGTAAQGQTLAASTGGWTGYPGPSFAYQWKADAVNISGATASTYLLTSSEVGKVITVAVTATNGSGSASATSSATSAVTGVVTLSALTFSPATSSAGAAFSATISGKTGGSTITATSSDGTTMTVSGTTLTGTFSAAGSPTITLTETLAGATNTPRTSTVGVTVSAAAVNELLVMAGQSNGISKATNGIAAPTNIQAIDTSRVKIWTGAAWAGYVAGTNSSQDATYTTAWGPEAEYARQWLLDNAAGTLYIVKQAVDSTRLAAGTGQDWSTASSGELLASLNTKVTNALTNLTGASVTLGQRRAIWYQGETDALDTQSFADAYYANLLSLFAYFRTNWSIGKIADVRIRTQNYAYPAIVRAAQNRVCYDDANAYLINADDQTLFDLYHIDGTGIVVVGSRCYDAIKNGTSIEAANSVPYAFTFTDLTGATLSSSNTSNTITVDGLTSGTSATVTITGGTYSKNGGAATSASGTAVNGDTFSVTGTASGSYATGVDVVLTIGGVSDTYTVTTQADPGATEDVDTTAFFNAVNTAGLTAPDSNWRAAYDTLIKAAKGGSNPWWSSCDLIFIPGTYDRAVARRNLKQDAFHLVESAAPSWTAKTGLTAAGGKYTSTYNPASAAGRVYAQDSAHYGVWINNNVANSGGDINMWSGSAGNFFVTRSADATAKTQTRINQSANLDLVAGIPSSAHDWVVSRTASNVFRIYTDGTDWNGGTNASIAPVSATLEVGALGAGYTGRQYKAITVGSGLTAAQVAQRNSDLANFFTATASL